MIKNWLLFVLCLFLIGCMAGHRIMTMDTYSTISIGMSEQELIKIVGSPYAINEISPNERNFEYIERIVADYRMIEERHYYFLIRDHRVVEKQVRTETRPAYDQRNSFDLQTSFQKEEH